MKTKLCKPCNQIKDLTEFYKDNSKEDKLTGVCKLCCRARERATHKKNPDRKWEYKHKHLVSPNGEIVTKSLFTRLVELQENKCGICCQPMKIPCLDHNHSTGMIRSVLCPTCNTMIGLAKEDVSILTRAISYLEKFNN